MLSQKGSFSYQQGLTVQPSSTDQVVQAPWRQSAGLLGEHGGIVRRPVRQGLQKHALGKAAHPGSKEGTLSILSHARAPCWGGSATQLWDVGARRRFIVAVESDWQRCRGAPPAAHLRHLTLFLSLIWCSCSFSLPHPRPPLFVCGAQATGKMITGSAKKTVQWGKMLMSDYWEAIKQAGVYAKTSTRSSDLSIFLPSLALAMLSCPASPLPLQSPIWPLPVCTR